MGKGEFNEYVSKIMIQMWQISGDFISKIYAGTNAVLQAITAHGK